MAVSLLSRQQAMFSLHLCMANCNSGVVCTLKTAVPRYYSVLADSVGLRAHQGRRLTCSRARHLIADHIEGVQQLPPPPTFPSVWLRFASRIRANSAVK